LGKEEINEIVELSEVIEEAQDDMVDIPEPLHAGEITDPHEIEEKLAELPEELKTHAAQGILKKIDEGLEWAERGVRQFFNTSPKRAVEFQQNYISFLELKAKILKLISDTGSTKQQAVSAQQNNIIVDPESAKELVNKLVKKLYE